MRPPSLFAGALLPSALAQFLSAPTDLTKTKGNGFSVRYKEVPDGICETIEGVKSFSGYIDVEERQHLFFWFFEARNQDPTTAPLTLWLNGGPGDPSMVGLFSENGPCWVDHHGDLQFNEYSWTNVSNMLYIDQPTDTGFSYSIPVAGYTDPDTGSLIELSNATCPASAPAGSCGTFSSGNANYTVNSTLAAAPYVWKALQGFVGAFPQYASNGLSIATESYGGHYGPVFADYILQQNAKNIPGTSKLDLQSLSVGNGWFDPTIQFQAYYNFTVSPGNTYQFNPFNTTVQEQMWINLYGKGNCVDQLHECNYGDKTDAVCSAADNYCYDSVEYLYDTLTGRDEYDLRYLSPDPFPYTDWVAYLNKPEVQKAIGAFTNFTYSVTNLGAGTVSTAFGTTGDDSRAFEIIARNKKLVEHGLYVVHYAGDADYNCNWIGGEEVAAQISPAGFSSAGYENFTTPASSHASNSSKLSSVAGAVKQSDNYAFVRIYDSGHQVPFYKPVAALKLFERMLHRVDIATGQDVIGLGMGHRSAGPAKSTYQNDPATIQRAVTDASCRYDFNRDIPICGKDVRLD